MLVLRIYMKTKGNIDCIVLKTIKCVRLETLTNNFELNLYTLTCLQANKPTIKTQ